MAPVASSSTPETRRAKVDTRGRDMPGAKVGPISNPIAQPTRQQAMMSAKPACP